MKHEPRSQVVTWINSIKYADFEYITNESFQMIRGIYEIHRKTEFGIWKIHSINEGWGDANSIFCREIFEIAFFFVRNSYLNVTFTLFSFKTFYFWPQRMWVDKKSVEIKMFSINDDKKALLWSCQVEKLMIWSKPECN